MSVYNYNAQEIFNEGIISDSLQNCWELFKTLFNGIKAVTIKIYTGAKIPEIVNCIKNFILNLPIINKLIPNKQTEDERVKATLDDITTGDIVSGISNTISTIFGIIWKCIPATTNFKKEIILPIFNYNDRLTYLRTLYKIMVDNDVPPKYARAYLTIQGLMIPMYNILFVFKPIWYRKNGNKGIFSKPEPKDDKRTMDDLAHPWTSGNPNTNSETGLNEMEERVQRNVQKFIQIVKREDLTELEIKHKLAWQIIKDAIPGIVVPFLVPLFRPWKMIFGEGDYYPYFGQYFDGFWRIVLMWYYYYFLVTSQILVSLSVEEEETYHPTTEKETSLNQIV